MGNTSCCNAIQKAIFGNLEKFYQWFGAKVAKFSLWVIFGSLLFAGLTGLGLMVLESENDQLELWIPKGKIILE